MTSVLSGAHCSRVIVTVQVWNASSGGMLVGSDGVQGSAEATTNTVSTTNASARVEPKTMTDPAVRCCIREGRWCPAVSCRQLEYRNAVLAFEAGLPPIRLHDLRHGAATLHLKDGAEMKIEAGQDARVLPSSVDEHVEERVPVLLASSGGVQPSACVWSPRFMRMQREGESPAGAQLRSYGTVGDE
jgi:hypothetical protein